jgi:hypothetical protein
MLLRPRSSAALALLLLLGGTGTSVEAEQWALIAAGNRDYSNYRFQSDVAHAYQRLRIGGIPDERIISMSYDDVPTLPNNPYPGTLFNRATGQKPGVDVNHNFSKSYTSSQVSKTTFIEALTCSGHESTPCVASGSAEATLTIFWSGHGDAGFLFLPDMNSSTGLYADEFVAAILDAKSGAFSGGRSQGFAQVVVLVEACESGSMLQGQQLPAAGVYALTAAQAGENSYPIYCCSFFRPPSCTIDGRDISSCLGDIFATSVWEAAGNRSLSHYSLDELFEHVRAFTHPNGNPTGTGSRVTRFGDHASMGQLPFTDFIGLLPPDTASSSSSAGRKVNFERRQHDAGGHGRTRSSAAAVAAATATAEKAAAAEGALVEQLDAQLQTRLRPAAAAAEAAAAANTGTSSSTQQLQRRRSKQVFRCYRRLNARLDARCPPFVLRAPAGSGGPPVAGGGRQPPWAWPSRPRATSRYALMLRACADGAEADAVQAIAAVCTNQ